MYELISSMAARCVYTDHLILNTFLLREMDAIRFCSTVQIKTSGWREKQQSSHQHWAQQKYGDLMQIYLQAQYILPLKKSEIILSHYAPQVASI